MIRRVSTHSRPKAAGKAGNHDGVSLYRFQHTAARRRLALFMPALVAYRMFQHTAARRRLESDYDLIHKGLMFQHTAARRRLVVFGVRMIKRLMFQHTAARRRLAWCVEATYQQLCVSTHSRPKAAGNFVIRPDGSAECVSTHSRPKAAGNLPSSRALAAICFNTQPPEGGWLRISSISFCVSMFQHTAARRRLGNKCVKKLLGNNVSTHSRPKAAGKRVCLHTRQSKMFQHTAARRRLGNMNRELEAKNFVSTHSRPKAAGYRCYTITRFKNGFNTQPPEGGWYRLKIFVKGC